MSKIIVSSVLFILSAMMFALSVRSFNEKGFLFNNAYIYASKEERLRMDKKPHYRQSAIVFLLIGIVWALVGAAFISERDWIYVLAGAVMLVAIVYAIASSIKIEKKPKGM